MAQSKCWQLTEVRQLKLHDASVLIGSEAMLESLDRANGQQWTRLLAKALPLPFSSILHEQDKNSLGPLVILKHVWRFCESAGRGGAYGTCLKLTHY